MTPDEEYWSRSGPVDELRIFCGGRALDLLALTTIKRRPSSMVFEATNATETGEWVRLS